MPESGLTLDQLADNVNDELKRRGRCIVALSEGFDVGDLGARRDGFGHIEFGACDQTAQQVVVNYLNKRGVPTRGMARGQVSGTDQRSSIVLASTVDLEEAYQVGRHAVEVARREGNGWMSTLLRVPSLKYAVRYDKVPLEKVANSERAFPAKWLSPGKIDVTDDFLRYARPLIGEEWVRVPLEDGLQRFTRFAPIFADKKCPVYEPEAYRTK